MDDLISRQAAIKAVSCRCQEFRGIFARCEKNLNELPTAEKKGKWIPQDHNYKHGNVSTCLYFAPACSECGNSGDFNWSYCPNCGARMEV